MWHEPTADIAVPRNDAAADDPPTTTPSEEEQERTDEQMPSWLDHVLQVTFLVVVAALVTAAALSIWRRGVLRRRLTPRVPPPVPHAPRVPSELTEVADQMLEALHEGTPRNAIVACWVRLEGAVAATGSRRNPADTPTELVERVLADLLVDRHELETLAGLYREARFSTHELGESHRVQAVAALSGIREQLRRARPTVESVPSVGGP